MLLYLISWFQAQVAFLGREEGQDLAEYALLIALIAIAVIGAVTFLGEEISTIFSSIGDAFTP
ncbi:MAG: hypothetical protein MAG451_02275 [Anaerolineales bacterium]|nr:hypothetical protein [Anaerolineales bacterium]